MRFQKNHLKNETLLHIFQEQECILLLKDLTIKL